MTNEAWQAWDRWLSRRVLNMSYFKPVWEREKKFYRASFTDFIDEKLRQRKGFSS